MPSFEATYCRGRRATLIAVFIFFLFAFHLYDDYTHYRPLYWESRALKGDREWDSLPIEAKWIWNGTTDANNLLLSHTHCQQAFHHLFAKIDRSVRNHRALYHKIKKADLDKLDGWRGVVRALIYDQKLYIISTGGPISRRSFTVLSQIHRAIITSPEAVPNIEFHFAIDERPPGSRQMPQANQWAFARTLEDTKTWLMPDFGHFSWADTGVQSLNEVRTKAEEIDRAHSWHHKQSKLLWRGGTSHLVEHEDFLDATSTAPWADVQAIGFRKDDSANNLIDMDQYCRSKYLAHTESRNYDGRLKYLLLCNSVLITEPLRWVSYHSHLLVRDGPDQNVLEVRKDWSDLESKVRHLQSWDTLGERIARNSVATFRDRYLTPAAEVCSWRRLFRGWSEVSDFEPELFEIGEDELRRERGVLWERFVVDGMFKR